MSNSSYEKIYIVNRASEENIIFSWIDNTVYYGISSHYYNDSNTFLIKDVMCFDITVDSTENIHIVYVTNKGELCYLLYSNNSWKKEILKTFSLKSNSIDYIDIVSLNNSIHIFYSFQNIINSKLVRVIHLYSTNKDWKYLYLDSLTKAEEKKPYLINCDNNENIYFLSKIKEGKKFKFHLRTFSNKKMLWTSNGKLFFKENIENIYKFLVDSKKNFHYICSLKKHPRKLYHIYKSYNPSINNINYIKEVGDFSFFEYSNKLWIIWKKDNSLSYRFSTDFGITWSEITISNHDELYNIVLIGKKYKSSNINNFISSFGYFKNNTSYIIGIDDPFIFQNENFEIKNVNKDDYHDLKEYIPIIDDSKCQCESICQKSEENNIDEKEYLELDTKKLEKENTANYEEKKSFLEKIIDFLTIK